MKKTRLALVVGHSKTDNGAYNKKYDITEWQISKVLIAMIIPRLAEHIEPIYILRDEGKDGYNKLPSKINSLKPDHIIEFHCNSSSNVSAKGNEMLYYYKSTRSQEFAKILNNTVYNTLKVTDRGLKPIERKEQNGYHILKNTNAPCVIFEPAFLSSDDDVKNMLVKLGELAGDLAKALNEYFKG